LANLAFAAWRAVRLSLLALAFILRVARTALLLFPPLLPFSILPGPEPKDAAERSGTKEAEGAAVR
jgi:hypothetical protein